MQIREEFLDFTAIERKLGSHCQRIFGSYWVDGTVVS